MKFIKHSHKSGDKIVPDTTASKIESVLKVCQRPLRRRSATLIRQDILKSLRKEGWSDQVRISSKRGLTLTAKKGKTALCLQTGNMARFYADLLKLQAQFIDEKITSAIYVLPTRNAAIVMGENIANYERLTAELTNTFSKVITVPLLIYGFYTESKGGF